MNKADVKKNRNAIILLSLIIMLNAIIDIVGTIARTFFNQPTVYTLQAEQKLYDKRLKEYCK